MLLLPVIICLEDEVIEVFERLVPCEVGHISLGYYGWDIGVRQILHPGVVLCEG